MKEISTNFRDSKTGGLAGKMKGSLKSPAKILIESMVKVVNLKGRAKVNTQLKVKQGEKEKGRKNLVVRAKKVDTVSPKCDKIFINNSIYTNWKVMPGYI